MKPVMIHEDGTDCHHEGDAQRTVNDPEGPVCAGGLAVDQARIGDKVVSIHEACASFESMARALVSSISPLVAAYARFAQAVMESPHIRALAAAAAVVDEERAREETAGR